MLGQEAAVCYRSVVILPVLRYYYCFCRCFSVFTRELVVATDENLIKTFQLFFSLADFNLKVLDLLLVL